MSLPPSDPAVASPSRKLLHVLGPIVIAAFSLFMLAMTWRRWPDVLIDFGVQLYTAWQLSEGKLLYRDVAHVYGPLSPYVNALAFKALGQSMMSIAILNMLILAGILVLVYRLLTVVASRLAATVGCLVFVGVFAFGQYMPAGNYNFITPYVAEATQGLLLYLLAAFMLYRYSVKPSAVSVFIAGVFAGLLLLTKYELVVAGGAALLVQFVLARPWKAANSHVLLAAAGVVAPPVTAFALLSVYLPAAQAGRAVAGAAPMLANNSLYDLAFYREGMGIDAPLENVLRLLKVLSIYLLLAGPFIGSLWVRRHRAPWVVLVATFVCAAILTALMPIDWTQIARPFPAVMIAALIVAAIEARRKGLNATKSLRISLIIFALLLLVKMILNTRVYHYGFVLALPAALILVAILIDWLPALIERRHGDPNILIAASLGILLVIVAIHARVTLNYMAMKTVAVGTGGDTIYESPERAPAIEQAREEIEQISPATATLAVVPEGAMLNYLTRRRNPTPYLAYLPSDLTLHGEARINAAFARHPPDMIVVVTKNQEEYGQGNFGIDYAKTLGQWIVAHYAPIASPDRSVRILVRKAAPS